MTRGSRRGGASRPRPARRAGPRACARGTRSSRAPMADATCASLLPSAAGRASRRTSDGAVAVPAQRRGVERLDRVGTRGGVVARRGAGAASGPGRTAGTGTRGCAATAIPPWSWTASMDQRRLLSAGMGRSRNSPSRWPPRVVISSPTITANGRPRSSAMWRAASARVDPLVVGDRDDVEEALRRDVVEDLRDRRRAVRREAVDVEVRASLADRRFVGHPAPGSVALATTRSGQIGWKAPHHCSGASAMIVSNVAAIRAVSSVIRSRRVPSTGAGTWTSLPAYRPPERAPAGGDVHRHAGLDREEGGARRDRRGCPEERDEEPATRQVAVVDEAHGIAPPQRVEQGASRVDDRDQVRPHAAAALAEPARDRRVADGLHRRRRRAGRGGGP